MSADAKEKNVRDPNHLTIMPIQASLNPSPVYRRPAIAIIESLKPSQIRELVKQNKENIDYVRDLKFFANFSALPQAKSAEVLSENTQNNLENELNLDRRLQRVLQVSSASIPPTVLASQYRPNEGVVEKLLSAVFSMGEKATSKNAPKPALTPGPSPFDNSGESEEERKRKEKLKQSYSTPSPS